jgi:hypothetical protein
MKSNPWRQIHMDFHTSPLIPGVGAAFDAERFAATLERARVQSINLFARCHHGMYYYPTRLGRMHPALSFDLLGAEIAACRKRGIRTLVYDCVAWAEDVADRHPGWLQVDARGVAGMKKPFTAEIGGWRAMCLAEPGLVELIKAEIAEVHGRYRPEGFWIDIVIQFGCVCARCVADMQTLGLDPVDPAHVARHDRMVEIRFAREIFEFARALDSGLEIFFNGFAYEMDNMDDPEFSAARKRDYLTFLDVESLPSDDWGYTHFPVIANYLDTVGRTRPFTMMNGKFHTAWGDFESLRNREALEYECFRAAAAGAPSCVGDQLHPSGKIEPSVYERIGQVFSSLERKERWLAGTRKVAEIGVIPDAPVLGAAIQDQLRGNPSAEGAYRMLSETHLLFDFLDFTDDLAPYALVILADSVKVTPEEARKIDAYVRGGGKLLVTGTAGMDRGGTRFLVESPRVGYVSKAEYCPRYARIAPDAFPGIAPMDYVLYEQGVTVRGLPGATVSARIVNPYFNRTWEHFCSHRHTPPAALSEEPFVVRAPGCAYAAHPLFTDYALNGCRVYRDIVSRLIADFMGEPVVTADLPTTAELTLRRQGEDLILHVLHYIVQKKCRRLETVEEAIPLFDRKVSVRTGAAPRRVYLAPQEEDLPFRFESGRCAFTIPRVEGHQMVVIGR